MTVHVSVPFDDTGKAELDRIARHQNLTVEVLLRQIVEQRLAHERWVDDLIEEGLAEARAGRLLSHEEEMQRLDAHMAARDSKRA